MHVEYTIPTYRRDRQATSVFHPVCVRSIPRFFATTLRITEDMSHTNGTDKVMLHAALSREIPACFHVLRVIRDGGFVGQIDSRSLCAETAHE